MGFVPDHVSRRSLCDTELLLYDVFGFRMAQVRKKYEL